MVRLALVLLALFAVLSVPALVLAGRWAKGFGTSGLTADDAVDANRTIDGLKAQIETLTRERNEARKALREAITEAEALAAALRPPGLDPSKSVSPGKDEG
jgi:hypothetical protein